MLIQGSRWPELLGALSKGLQLTAPVAQERRVVEGAVAHHRPGRLHPLQLRGQSQQSGARTVSGDLWWVWAGMDLGISERGVVLGVGVNA